MSGESQRPRPLRDPDQLISWEDACTVDGEYVLLGSCRPNGPARNCYGDLLEEVVHLQQKVHLSDVRTRSECLEAYQTAIACMGRFKEFDEKFAAAWGQERDEAVIERVYQEVMSET